MVLRIGNCGGSVKKLQKCLVSRGYPVVPDGVYGHQTQAAVRNFQTRECLFPVDGIAGVHTLYRLGFDGGPEQLPPYGPQSLPPEHNPPSQKLKAPVASMHLSYNGGNFISKVEAKINHLYCPSDESGVTIGIGYDMKHRSQDSIYEDFISIGVDEDTARRISKARGEFGEKAREFSRENKDITITDEQMNDLLMKAAVSYEAIIKRHIKIALRQNEFDSLVSFVYNPAGIFSPVADKINSGNSIAAMQIIHSRLGKNKKNIKGLLRRRQGEIQLYLNGEYNYSKGSLIPFQ
jgi:GH24 family phage-related lysozyme (muramidase)|nr:peptidoglycan-binding protein [Acetobacter sp.]